MENWKESENEEPEKSSEGLKFCGLWESPGLTLSSPPHVP